MKINILTGPSFPVPPVQGGAVQKIWLDLANEFSKLGHEVTIYSRVYKNFPNQEIIDGIKHIRIGGFDQNKNVYIDLIKDFFYAWRLSKKIKPADITITNDFWLPYFTSKNKKLGKTVVNVGRYPKKQFFLYKNVDSIISVSKAINNAVLNEAPYLNEKLEIISNPINEKFLTSNIDEILKNKIKNRLLYVGRINKEKGIELLIDSFKIFDQYDNYELRIVGPYKQKQGGSGEAYLEYLKTLSKDSNIKFIGPIFDQNKLIEEYRLSSIFCYPSLAEKGEAFGVAPLEAMSVGNITIVSELECFKDFVVNNENAIVFNHRENTAKYILSEILKESFNQSNIRLINNAIKTAHNFSSNNIALNFIEVFKKLLEQK